MYTVLYVDDEPGLLELGKAFLEMSGSIAVETALSAEQGIRMLKNTSFDCVIADYQMPVMDGIKFLKFLRQEKNTIPFILFTGRGREEVVIEAVNSGVDYYLQKGGDPQAQFVELEHKTILAIKRWRTENDLKESRQRMTDIIDHLPDATFAIDINGKVIAWNRAMEEMTGVMKEQILGTGDHTYSLPFYGTRRPILLDLILREDPETEKKYPHIIRRDKNLISEIFIPLLYGGKGAFLWFIASPLYDTHGNVTGAIESIRDVTDRKKAEEALRQSEERYRAVIEDQSEFITRFLPEGTHIFVNEAYCRYFSKTPEEIIGTKFVPQLFDEDKPQVLQHLQNLTRQNPVETMEHRIIMPDGQVRWQQWSDRAIFDEQGNLVEYQSVGRDITERKKAEDELRVAYEQITGAEEELREQYDELKKSGDALRESEERYRSLVETISDWVWEVDEHGVYTYVSPRVHDLIGYTSDEVLGKTPFDFMLHDDAARVREIFSTMAALQKPFLSLENANLHKNGRTVIFETSGVPVFNRDGQFSGYRGIDRDITTRKEAEKEIQESRTRLEEIVHGSPIPQFVIDKDHRVISWNQALEEYSGVMAKDVIRTTDTWKAFYEKRRPVLADLLVDNAIDRIPVWYTGKSAKSAYVEGAYEATDFFPRMGENGVWLYFTASTIRDSEGTIIGAIETLQDITDSKKKEEALTSSEEKYRSLVNNLNVGVYRNSAELPGRWLWANPAFLRMFGYVSLEEFQGLQVTEMYVNPEERRVFLTSLREQGFVRDFKVQLRRKDGTPVWVSVSAQAKKNAQGTIEWIDGICYDITEKKMDEEALRTSEEMYRAILNNTGSATIIIEEDTKISFVNPEFERIMGYTKEEVEGKKYWTGLVAPEDVEQMNQYHILRRTDPDKAPRNYEFRFITKDRQVRNAYLTIGIIPGTRKTIASFVDITENKHAEKALRESERNYRNILDNIQDVYYRSDRDGNFTMFSPSGLRLLGYGSEEELLGRSIAETVYADPSERRKFLQVLDKEGFVNNFEVTLKRRDSTSVIVETSSHKYYDETGNFLGVEGIFRDITQRKQAEAALEGSVVMYRTIFENTGTATVLIEDNTIISLANAEFERLSGYSRAEIEGKKSWTEFVVREDLDRMRAQHVLRRERQEAVLNHYEFRFVTKSGATRKIFLTIDIIPGTKRSVASLLDITDKVAAREDLKQTNKKLTLINSITRHDMANQLSTLTGFIELSKRKVTDPELLRFIEKEENAVGIILEQIEFAKNYEIIGTNDPQWQRLENTIPRSFIPSPIMLQEESGNVEILADPMLPKVFYNLIDNSVRHGQTVTEIRISILREKEGRLVIIYEDNGIGIPAPEKELIFNREFGKNTGLGLFLIREILAITGITIRENGTPGTGARFEILVPKGANRFMPA